MTLPAIACHVAALAGLDVVLNDVSAERLKSAMATINGNLSRQVAKSTITEDARKQALDRITSAESLDGLSDCDLVIETAVEKEEVKRKIFHDRGRLRRGAVRQLQHEAAGAGSAGQGRPIRGGAPAHRGRGVDRDGPAGALVVIRHIVCGFRRRI